MLIGVDNHADLTGRGIPSELLQDGSIADFGVNSGVFQQFADGLPEHGVCHEHERAEWWCGIGLRRACRTGLKRKHVFGSGKWREAWATGQDVVQSQCNLNGGRGKAGAAAGWPQLMRSRFGYAEGAFTADDPAEEQPSDELLDQSLRVFVAPRAKDNRQVRQPGCGTDSLKGRLER
jgi:hypothetical protein